MLIIYTVKKWKSKKALIAVCQLLIAIYPEPAGYGLECFNGSLLLSFLSLSAYSHIFH